MTDKSDLLDTANRLREQAGRLRLSAQLSDNAQDLNDARDCERRAEQMEKEAAAMRYGCDGPCKRQGCGLQAPCPDCGTALVDFVGD